MTPPILPKTILVVEDDGTYLHLWRRLIQELGAKFCATKSVAEAESFLKTKPVDILISDILLPDKNGYELAKFARRENPKMEILLTTGYQTDLSRFDLVGLRCHLLHKPYHNLNDVCKLLLNLLNKKSAFEGMDEDSFSENEYCPEITEWIL